MKIIVYTNGQPKEEEFKTGDNQDLGRLRKIKDSHQFFLIDEGLQVEPPECILLKKEAIDFGRVQRILFGQEQMEAQKVLIALESFLFIVFPENKVETRPSREISTQEFAKWNKEYTLSLALREGALVVKSLVDLNQSLSRNGIALSSLLLETKEVKGGIIKPVINTELQGKIRTWISQRPSDRGFVKLLITETEGIGERMCLTAKLLLGRVGKQSVATLFNLPLDQIDMSKLENLNFKGIAWSAKPQFFMPAIDTSTHYIYIDYRYITRNISNQDFQFLKFYSCTLGSLEGLTYPNDVNGNVYVPLKYHQMSTFAPLIDFEALGDLYSEPLKVLSNETPWEAKSWFMIFCLAETVRHQEWYFMGKMALELLQDNVLPCSILINGFNDGNVKYWPPQTQFAVRSMTAIKSRLSSYRQWNLSTENQDQNTHLTSCEHLINWWLVNRYYKSNNSLPKSDSGYAGFNAWAINEIKQFIEFASADFEERFVAAIEKTAIEYSVK